MKHLPIRSSHFQWLYTEFSSAISAQGYSWGREPMYPSLIREFLYYIEAKGLSAIDQVKALHVINYYEYLRQRPNYRRKGKLGNDILRQHLYSLRLFFDHLVQINVLQGSPAHIPKFYLFKIKEREPLSIEEIKQIYSACKWKQDRAILALAYGCGLRRSEMVKLNVNDVLFTKGMLQVREGKYGKSRMIPLADPVLNDLRDYLHTERAQKLLNRQDIQAFLVNRFGKRRTGYSINGRLKRIIKRTGNPELIQKQVSLHHLRHSIATHLIDQGADMTFVKNFLGHVLLDTTHIYSKRRKQRRLIQQQLIRGP